VVTRAAKPFVFVDGPVETVEECYTDIPCLYLANSSRSYVISVVNNFVSFQRSSASLGYKIFCCKGISMELLQVNIITSQWLMV
jgi:hypothetical protein